MGPLTAADSPDFPGRNIRKAASPWQTQWNPEAQAQAVSDYEDVVRLDPEPETPLVVKLEPPQ